MAPKKRDAAERFWSHVTKTPTCWLWGGEVRDGWGRFKGDAGRNVPVHRYAYELLIAPIPAGMVIDHVCRVRNCVNPGHLEPVPNRTNVLRGIGPTAQNARKTHCKRGHEFTPENTGNDRKGRWCRTCKREDGRKRRYAARIAREGR